MSLPTDMNVEQPSGDQLLKFSCSTCGVRLVVDQALAGTEGPCPSCGVTITAPQLVLTQDIVDEVGVTPEKDGEKGYDVMTLGFAEPYPPAVEESIAIQEEVGEKLAVKQSSGMLFKVLCAILLILLIAGNVYLYLKSNQ